MASDLDVLPASKDATCTFLKAELCAEFSKDPLTIITNAWGSLQLTWTFMLLFVHFYQVARNITTYESMRNSDHVNPLMTAVAAGTMNVESAQLDSSGGGPNPTGHAHKLKKKEGFLTRCGKMIGADVFIAIAFSGYKGHKNKKQKQPKRTNPFTRGILRNCQDFWMDGPVFGRKPVNKGLLNGEVVDYAVMYDVPRGGMNYRRGGYEEVATVDTEEV